MRLAAMLFLAFLSGIPVCAKEGPDCWPGSKATRNIEISRFVLRLTPNPHIANSVTGEGCRAELVDRQHKVRFVASDWGISLVLGEKDVNGDGIPDLVLEGYSGGAHCCWTYYVVSLGRHPGLLAKFENERDAGFRLNSSTGRMEIKTMDGNFDYFDDFCHACSPFPDVYLRLDGTKLVDISRDYLREYDKQIEKLKREIPAKDLAVFLQAENKEEKVGWENVSSKVISIVLAYLCSGREAEARDALKKMWPPFDQDRIWRLILETRRKGILRYTRGSQG
jgi:hypothetical protein